MGIGPKVPIEGDLLIATQQPTYIAKSPSNVQVSSLYPFVPFSDCRSGKSKNQLEKPHPQSCLNPTSQTNPVS